MQHFPIFIALDARRVIVAGGGEAALAKLRLLFKTTARLHVFSPAPDARIESWAKDGRLTLHRHALREGDAAGAALVYAAQEDRLRDAAIAAIARRAGVLVNIVDNLDDSDFITPAIVDRDPVTVAIGTEGTAPVLARAIKARIEEQLSPRLGLLARAAQGFRTVAEALPKGAPRRAFWAEFFATEARPDDTLATLTPRLTKALARHARQAPPRGSVRFAMAAHDDPEMLTLKARKALHEADVVLHEAAIAPGVLELARREALFTQVTRAADTPHLARLLRTHALKGHAVVLLTRDPAPAALLDACRAAGLDSATIPGLAALPPSLAEKERA